MSSSRRDFLKFLGSSGLMLSALGTVGCSHKNALSNLGVENSAGLDWMPLVPTAEDDLVLAKGLNYKILARWQDSIASETDPNLKFGAHCDFTSFIPFDEKNPNEGFLMVNHEYLNSLFTIGWLAQNNISKTKEQIETEMAQVGASVLHVKKTDGQWKIVLNSKHNVRFDGQTPIPLIAEHEIEGSKMSYGTLANCAGGKTPWNTFLTCEENYDIFWGEWDYRPKPGTDKLKKRPQVTYNPKLDYLWYNKFDRPATHYGWVVEIDPVAQKAKKLTALGRFAHECATCVKVPDGRTVVYMGDDTNDECIYKFISEKPGSLEKGTLYVANTVKGIWVPLTLNSHPRLKKLFKNQTELLVNTRLAAEVVGGTPQDRPEDIEINPANGDVIVALTNNTPQGRPHGCLFKIKEKNADHLAMEFTSEQWIAGGEDQVLTCPDNMVFDKGGNLWVTTDVGDDVLNQGVYKRHKNNGLYYIPMKGPHAGQVFQVASAPVEAEFTGPCFSPDGETLFLSVQHPGEQTKSLDKFTSSWPDGKGKMPKSSLVTIQGPLLQKLTS